MILISFEMVTRGVMAAFHSETALLISPEMRAQAVTQDISLIQPTFPFATEQCHKSRVCKTSQHRAGCYFLFFVPVGQDRQAKTAGERIISFPYR